MTQSIVPAAQYLRMSTDDQQYSLDNQADAISRYAADHGFVIVKTYSDAARVELWGKDLYAHLSDIYGSAARFCVLFVSASYARRVWTNHERAAAQERAIRENGEYVLPARFDGTSIPGLRRTMGYIDLKKVTPAELAKMIAEKLGGRQRTAFLRCQTC